MTIAVIGEALIDLIQGPGGAYIAHPGGSPYNLAIGLGRQDADVAYLSPLSQDRFGAMLERRLVDSNVTVSPDRSACPTSLAVVMLDSDGKPSYGFYREGVADRDTTVERLAGLLPDDLSLVHSGSLALAPADVGRIATLFEAARGCGAAVSCDVNMRPSAVGAIDDYVAGVRSLFPLCDIVKASDEDLEALGYREDPERAANAIVREMGGGLVAVTLGEHGSALVSADQIVRQPAWPVAGLADTVGSGDTFYAGLLAWLCRHNVLTRTAIAACTAERLNAALAHACASAAINLSRGGCEPPTLAEVRARIANS